MPAPTCGIRWRCWPTRKPGFLSLHWLGGEGFFRWFVFDDPDWDFTSFDYDADLQYAAAAVRLGQTGLQDHQDPDRPQATHHTKLIF